MKKIEICPQTVIQNFNNNTCLFMCYVYCCGLIPDSIQDWLSYYITALNRGVIGEDGFVLDGAKLIQILSGRSVKVTKRNISSLSDVKKKSPVLFSVNGKDGHFVVVENGEIIFNPLEVSYNVNKGKPISVRDIEFI